MAIADFPLLTAALDSKLQSCVQTMIDEFTTSGLETGLQVAAYHNGELVVDAWSGIANPHTGEPVQRDTLFVTFSCSKGVTATVIHRLAEQGKLDYDTPVAHYWPEFGANGKENITVRHVLSHQAGVPYLPHSVTPNNLGDLEQMSHYIEQMKPIWAAGTKTAYHGLTIGVILGTLAQRCDGRPFAQIVQEEICEPLGISDLFFGIPEALEEKVAEIGGARLPLLYFPSFFPIKKMVPEEIEPGPIWNQSAIQRGVIPAGNMITTARSLARHYAALCGDGVDGIRLLSPERVKIATTLQTRDRDWVFLGGRIRKAMGYWLGGDGDDALGNRTTVFGHSGMGGSLGLADQEYNFSFALVKNQMTWRGSDDTDCKLVNAIREELGLPN